MSTDGPNGASASLPIKVLLIEDNPSDAFLLEQMLSQNGHQMSFALECERFLAKGLEHLTKKGTDLVLLDLSLPDSSGLDTFLKVQKEIPGTPIVVLSNLEDEALALEAVKQGAQDYLVKGQVEGKVLLHVMRYAVERKRAEEMLRESEQRLRRQNKVLVSLAKSKNLSSGNITSSLKEITKAAAETLEVEQVTIWMYDASHKMLRCASRYERSAGTHSEGDQLEVARYPDYFESLESGRFIAVQNIQSDEQAKEFRNSDLPERGITSMLDSPIRLGGRTVGIISHWHTNSPRFWTLEEQNFAGSMADLISLAMEASERKRAEQRLSHLAYYDVLTDLPNRLLFAERLERAIVAARHKEALVGVLFLGLDHFKRINDTLGHEGGDDLLKAVAERLKKALRYMTDAVSRIDGDSFVVLLSDIWRSEDAINIAERISEALKPPFIIGSQEFFMTCSIGISFYPSDGRDPVELLKNADTAMYRAKQQGKNNYQLYSPAMNAKALERLVLENSLRHALERNEFQLLYQPLVDLSTGAITGAEALLRWKHPDLGLISPRDFISLAEETGLIVPIGEWVLHTAAAQNQAWQQAGHKPIRISVNLSARQFQLVNLSDVIRDCLKSTGLAAEYLELELTESLIMQNADASIATLRQLSDMGVRLSIDDFGTGYSSLNYLKRFPIHTLKIDESFVRDLTTDSDDAAIVKAIISMAHSLKLEVVAECVETQAQLEFLRDNQCDRMQGFLFSRPITPTAFAELLKKK